VAFIAFAFMDMEQMSNSLFIKLARSVLNLIISAQLGQENYC